MTTPASIRRHPLHPMLVALPVGLWVFSFVCDLFFLVGGDPTWAVIAFFTLAGGWVGALIAAVPGFIDFLALRVPRARRVAAAHMGLNLALVVLVGLNLWLRWNGTADAVPIALSGVGVAVLAVSGWLGGHLVHVLGVTMDPEATASRREPGADAGVVLPRRADPSPRGR
jgi:uncharacterized membrane protein